MSGEVQLVSDVLIVGQGPAAYAAALYAARYRLQTVVVGTEPGGETATAGAIENYPGFLSIDGFELTQRLRDQVANQGVRIVNGTVQSVAFEGGCWGALLAGGGSVTANALILATGRERRSLGLPHELEWTGRGISYCATCDAPLNRGKVVGVVGGGNAAVQAAIQIALYAQRVYLIHRGESLARADPIELEVLQREANVTTLYRTEVGELLGNDEGLAAVRLTRPFEGSDELPLDSLFVEVGAEPRSTLAAEVGAELDPGTKEVRVDRQMRTSVSGLFAAGDVTDAAALKQTITAAAQGAVAALSTYQYVSTHGRRCVVHERAFPVSLGAESMEGTSSEPGPAGA